jgi:hypothetical protein
MLFKEIHLFTSNYISDMGLCRKISDTDKINICGFMPYVAPEVLRGNLILKQQKYIVLA